MTKLHLIHYFFIITTRPSYTRRVFTIRIQMAASLWQHIKSKQVFVSLLRLGWAPNFHKTMHYHFHWIFSASTSSGLVGLVSRSNKIIKMQSDGASKRQCSVLHVCSIWYWEYHTFEWLIDRCTIVMRLSITLVLHCVRLPKSKQLLINIHDGPMFLFNVFLVFSLPACWLSCECQDNLQFDSLYCKASYVESRLLLLLLCYCCLFFFFYCTAPVYNHCHNNI